MWRIKTFLHDILHGITRPLHRVREHLVTFAAGLIFALLWKVLNLELGQLGEGYDGAGACLVAGAIFWVWLNEDLRDRQKHLQEGQTYKPLEIIFFKIFSASIAAVLGRVVFSILPPWDNAIGAILGVCFTGLFIEPLLSKGHGRFVFHRGATIISSGQAEAQIKAMPEGQEPPIELAGYRAPGSVGEGNILMAGAIGTGKTRMQRETFGSVLVTIRPGSDRRAILYDVKSDALAEIEQMNPQCDIIVMDPYDRRSFAWDIAADVIDAADARNFAETLIPDAKGDDKPFFIDAARNIMAGVIDSFNERQPGSWTLRDLVRGTALKERLERILAGSDLIGRYFNPPDTFANIMNTIANVMVRLEPVAGAWEHTSRKISLKNWADTGDSVLVLAGKPGDVALQHINRVMCKVVSTMMLNGPESPSRSRFWFFCDELKDAGRLDCLDQLLNGRSKGVRCVLGFQDLEGLIHAYGSVEKVKEMISRCKSVSWLKLTSPDTAAWASERTGESEQFEYFDVQSKDGTTINEHLTKRESVLKSEFMHMPDFHNGYVTGIHIMHGVAGVFKSRAHYTFPKIDRAKNFQPRDASEKKLSPWTDADDKRFGLKELEDTKPTAGGADTNDDGPDLDDFGRLKFI